MLKRGCWIGKDYLEDCPFACVAEGQSFLLRYSAAGVSPDYAK